jgi:hypothetical protein
MVNTGSDYVEISAIFLYPLAISDAMAHNTS